MCVYTPILLQKVCIVCIVLLMSNRRNIYIRTEDIAAWDRIENKSEWIHEKLLGVLGHKSEFPKKQLPAAPAEEKTVPKANSENEVTYCNNGHPIPEGRVQCLGKSCKYS